MMRTNEININWENTAIVLLATVLTIFIFALNFSVKGPMIQADEGSYLANAAAIAGFRNDMASSYHAGYSMLIAPAFWVADTPQSIWMGVKIINAGLFLLAVVALGQLARHIAPEVDMGTRLTAVTLVSLYPMWVVMVGYSFAQIAFVPVFLMVTLVYIRAVSAGTTAWLRLGIITGFLYWIHPTAVATLIAVCIAMTYVAWRQCRYGSLIVLVLSILTMVLIYQQGVVPWLHDRMTISGQPPNLHYPGISKLLTPLLTWSGLKNVIARTGGHVFYLSIGTVGLFWVGLFSLWKTAIQPPNTDNDHFDASMVMHYLAIFLLFAFLGTITLSILLFSTDNPDGQRLDHWMYGRYVEGVIAPILLVGVLTQSLRKLFWVLPVAGLAALLLAMDLKNYIHTAPFNVSAFWQEFYLRDQGLWAWLVAGCALVALAGSLPRRVGLVVIFVVFIFSDYLQVTWHKAASKNASTRWEAALTVRNTFPTGSCVGFDHLGINSYKRHVFWCDFGFQLFDYQLKRMSFERWLKDCEGPFFSYSKDLDEKGYDVYVLGGSPDGGPLLWMKGRPADSDVYPISVENHTSALWGMLGTGWHDLERRRVWSGKEALLRLPVPKDCKSGECAVKINFSVYGASEQRPVNIFIRDDIQKQCPPRSLVIRSSARQELIVPLSASASIQRLSIEVPDAISPKDLQGSHDTRVLGLSLFSVELIKEFDPECIVSGCFTMSARQLLKFSKVGKFIDGYIRSDGRRGFLFVGPYWPLKAGKYVVEIDVNVKNPKDAVVDVVSAQGKTSHMRVAIQDASIVSNKLRSTFSLSEAVSDLEVRLFVGEKSEISVAGYKIRLAQ